MDKVDKRFSLLVLALLALTACGARPAAGPTASAQTSSRSTPSRSASASASPSATTSAGAWVAKVDPGSGVGFVLPADAQVQRQSGAQGEAASYQGNVDGVQVGVGITPVGVEATRAQISRLAHELATRLVDSGAQSARIVHERPVSMAGHPGLDFAVRFVGRTGTDVSYWDVRELAVGTSAVAVQSIAFGHPGDLALQRRVAALQRRLVAGLDLSHLS